jgi:F-type H+-transporting ATPase subunit b
LTISEPYDTFCNSQAALQRRCSDVEIEKQHVRGRAAPMISLDWSIIPAIVIFVATIFVLNLLLFKPVLRVQGERERRTTGLMSQVRKDLDHHMQLFDQYQATIKNARLEGYRLVEKSRAEAFQYRNGKLEQGRGHAELLIQEARGAIQNEVTAAKAGLEREARDIADQIASAIMQRPA